MFLVFTVTTEQQCALPTTLANSRVCGTTMDNSRARPPNVKKRGFSVAVIRFAKEISHFPLHLLPTRHADTLESIAFTKVNIE